MRRPRITERDREIFEAVMVNGERQQAVAARYQLKQPAVSKIVRKMKLWLSDDAVDPPCPDLAPRGREPRLFTEARIHRRRLEMGFSELMESWRESKKNAITLKKSGKQGGDVTETSTAKTQCGNPRFIMDAMKLSLQKVEFDGMDRFGAFDIADKKRLLELPSDRDTLMKDARAAIAHWQPLVDAWEREQQAKEQANLRAAAAALAAAEASSSSAPDQAAHVCSSAEAHRYAYSTDADLQLAEEAARVAAQYEEYYGMREEGTFQVKSSSDRDLENESTCWNQEYSGIYSHSNSPSTSPIIPETIREYRKQESNIPESKIPKSGIPKSSIPRTGLPAGAVAASAARPQGRSTITTDIHGRMCVEVYGSRQPLPAQQLVPTPSKLPMVCLEEGD